MKARLYAELTSRLDECRQRLERGEDVAPLETGRLEGLLEALVLAGESPPAVLAWSAKRFPAGTLLQIALSATGRLQLRLRQARAPVTPSTSAN